RTWCQFWKDRVPDQSAMLSFYFLLSLFPLLLLLTAVLSVLLQAGPVFRDTLHHYLAAVVPQSASTLIDTTLVDMSRGSGMLTISVALLFTWWSASQGMLAIVRGLNIAYDVGESRPWWKQYLVASALTIACLLLFASALLLLIYGARFSTSMARQFGYSGAIADMWPVLAWLLSLGFVLTAFNVLYIFAPNVKHQRWHWLMPGTIVGMTIWLSGSFGLKLYLGFFNSFTVAYGSIGAVIALLLWFYMSGIAVLVGAEVNWEIEKASRHEPLAQITAPRNAR
ncbi:MAG: YihY/virulence factor BrkB family protein, partial [Candidatus Dormibacteraeota bacterium]|nr:YihY/virulence factor BrkB family protein [Candidatus Dormibacteraeota bacterium]